MTTTEGRSRTSVVERDHCATITRRKARKRHRCECGAVVQPGEVYLLHKAFPGHDVLDLKAPWSMVECAACAQRRQRGPLLQEAAS